MLPNVKDLLSGENLAKLRDAQQGVSQKQASVSGTTHSKRSGDPDDPYITINGWYAATTPGGLFGVIAQVSGDVGFFNINAEPYGGGDTYTTAQVTESGYTQTYLSAWTALVSPAAGSSVLSTISGQLNNGTNFSYSRNLAVTSIPVLQTAGK